jgi:hypothetical protein
MPLNKNAGNQGNKDSHKRSFSPDVYVGHSHAQKITANPKAVIGIIHETPACFFPFHVIPASSSTRRILTQNNAIFLRVIVYYLHGIFYTFSRYLFYIFHIKN